MKKISEKQEDNIKAVCNMTTNVKAGDSVPTSPITVTNNGKAISLSGITAYLKSSNQMISTFPDNQSSITIEYRANYNGKTYSLCDKTFTISQN